jgi:DNA-directed RNA polymerase specialized sigma24 family protein
VTRIEREALHAAMVRLADGDRTAFDPVYRALWPVLLRFAERAVGAPEAEDAAQAVLLNVFARASELDPARDALTWVLGIAAWEHRTRRRRARRCREDHPPDAGASLPDLRESPEDAALARDLAAAMRDVAGSLSPADAETLALVLDGRRPDAPSATFRKRLERATQRLRAAWRSRHGTE